MKKFLSIMLVIILFLMVSSTVFAHSGNVDRYGGHFVKDTDSGLWVAYHYHGEGSYTGQKEYLGDDANIGWQVTFPEGLTLCEKQALALNKPFTPGDDSIGDWIQVTFGENGEVITPTPTATPTATPTITTSTTPTSETSTSPTPSDNNVSSTPSDTSGNVTSNPTSTPTDDVITIAPTATTGDGEELPETGEGTTKGIILICIGLTCVIIGVWQFIKNYKNLHRH